MSEVKVDLEGMRRRAQGGAALASKSVVSLSNAFDAWPRMQHLAADVIALCAEVERLRDELKGARGAVVGSLRTHRENQAKAGVLLGEIADTAIAFGMMAPNMRDAIDGPNAIQFLQQMRERRPREYDVIAAAKQWFKTLAKSDMSPHAAREALARAVIALDDA